MSSNLTMPPHRGIDNLWLHFFQMGHLSSTNARPTVLVRGEGSRVWDQDGNEYIDGLSGLFCVNLGYNRQEIITAISAQLQQIAYVSPFSFPNLPQLELAARLARLSPTGPDSRCFFVSGGSEAVETALKMARAYHRRRGAAERQKIIARRAAYHGTTMGALSLNGVTSLRNGFGALLPGARHAPVAHPYRCPACSKSGACSGWCADEIARIIEFEGPETVAAVILEPVQNSGGAIVPPPGYLQRVRRICEQSGVLLIMDEVICGFGRVGAWFGSSAFGLQPDIITCAKGLTGGYAPLGAAIASAQIADAFLGDEELKFLHGITFGGMPASCAAALAALEIIEREELCNRSTQLGDYMQDALHQALQHNPHVGDIRGMGMFVAIELVRDRSSRIPLDEPNLMAWLSDQFRRRGLICRADDRLDPVVQLAPPLTTPLADLDQIIAIVAEVLDALPTRASSTAPRELPLQAA